MSGETDLDGRPGASGRAGALARLGRVRRSPEVVAGEASAAAAGVAPTPPVPDPSAAAFFDVDNTLMRGASIYHFARGLAARKLFGTREMEIGRAHV